MQQTVPNICNFDFSLFKIRWLVDLPHFTLFFKVINIFLRYVLKTFSLLEVCDIADMPIFIYTSSTILAIPVLLHAIVVSDFFLNCEICSSQKNAFKLEAKPYKN